MSFWDNTWSNVLGGLGAAILLLVPYLLIQWFLQATDLVVSYSWRFVTIDNTTSFRPAFDIRNRSRSKAYRLANIAYSINGSPHWFDNQSVWGKVLEPGSITVDVETAPVARVTTIEQALSLEVTLRTQSGRSFWLRGEGPNQEGKNRFRRLAFRLREKLESWMIALE